uniref:Selenoprotein M n=1 Tax=Electrophorus electricus TaxID=8005 RepID=A0AAY5EQD1_ELEEL
MRELLLCLHSFYFLDFPHFSHNLVMKHIPGADPELVLLNHYYEELDRIPLADMTRTEINKLLAELVPEEFRFSPAKDSPFREPPTTQLPTKTDFSEEPQSKIDPSHKDL